MGCLALLATYESMSEKATLFWLAICHFFYQFQLPTVFVYFSNALQLTWADLGFLSLNDLLKMINGDDQIDKRPKLSALRSRIQNLPKIAEWLAKRPNTIN